MIMGCGCGGGGNGGGCGGHQQPAAPAYEAAMLQEPKVFEPEESEQAEAAPAELIASSEQEWPRIKVNGVAIAAEAIAQEMQYHPAGSREEAVFLASQALVIRELLQQRIAVLGLKVSPAAGESEEEA